MSVAAVIERALGGRVPRTVTDPTRTEAAVAVVLAAQPNQLLLIRRAEHPRDPWSGQMGLPGGRRDAADSNLLTTALRETSEEVGLDLSAARMVGALDDLAPTTSLLPPIIVRPHVFVLETAVPPLVLSHEVQYVRWVSVDEFQRPGVLRPYTFEHDGLRITRNGYHLGDDVVWGITERILTPLLALIRTARGGSE